MEHKRGDTFNYVAAIPLNKPDGYFAEFEPTCQIRRKNGSIMATVATSWVDPVTTRLIQLKCDASVTELWPIGEAKLDIQLTRVSDGYVQSTTTVEVEVVEDITRV